MGLCAKICQATLNLSNIFFLWPERAEREENGLALGKHPAGRECPAQVAQKGTLGFCTQLGVTVKSCLNLSFFSVHSLKASPFRSPSIGPLSNTEVE